MIGSLKTGLLFAGCLTFTVIAQQPEVIPVQENGPKDKRLNIVIAGDGYQAHERDDFITHVDGFFDAILEAMPFAEYSNYINVYGIFVVSNSSGAGGDTQFDSRYSGRLLTVNSSKVYDVLDDVLPEYDIPFVVVNDNTYGGSGGSVSVANYSTPEIVNHEMGHSFAGLADEYEYPGGSPREAPNITSETSRQNIVWNHWIEGDTPLPTPETNQYDDVVGLFEGAGYTSSGWYRPRQNCRMRTNGVPLCEPCREAYILSMYDLISPLESYTPDNTQIVYSTGNVNLQVTPMIPETHDITVHWLVNDELQTGQQTGNFQKALAPGTYTIKALLVDETFMVREDPDNLLQDEVEWQVNVDPNNSLIAARESKLPSVAGATQGMLRVFAPTSGVYQVEVLTLKGTPISTLQLHLEQGGRSIHWKSPLAAGVYFVRIKNAGGVVLNKVTILP